MNTMEIQHRNVPKTPFIYSKDKWIIFVYLIWVIESKTFLILQLNFWTFLVNVEFPTGTYANSYSTDTLYKLKDPFQVVTL